MPDDFQEILVIAGAATLSDCDTSEAIVEWGRSKRPCINRLLATIAAIGCRKSVAHRITRQVFEHLLAVEEQRAIDLSLGDDAGTVRQDHAAQNRSPWQKIRLNLIRLETKDKTQRGLRRQRNKAAKDEDIRKTLLGLTPQRPPGGEIRQGA